MVLFVHCLFLFQYLSSSMVVAEKTAAFPSFCQIHTLVSEITFSFVHITIKTLNTWTENACANIVDPDQTAQRSSLIRVYTVCQKNLQAIFGTLLASRINFFTFLVYMLLQKFIKMS